jgi:predicted site-specific integrase-resolvase
MSKLVSISAASRVLGVSQTTLRRWECSGRLVPHRTAAGHRRYDLSNITAGGPSFRTDQGKTVAYARVSSSDQQADLERQKQVLEIITVFSARLYGSRSRKNQKLIDGVGKVVEEVS